MASATRLVRARGVLQRKINLLNCNYESMQDDTIKRYIEDLKKSLEDLKLNVKARALIFDEFTWSWLSYLWVISGKTIEEICDRACSIADLNMRLEAMLKLEKKIVSKAYRVNGNER